MSSASLTRDAIVDCFDKATKIGTLAANTEVEVLAKKKVPEGNMLGACGGSVLNLHVDGRSKAAKMLLQLNHKSVVVNKAYGGGFNVKLPYSIKIVPPVNGQEQSIYYAADAAAAEYIRTNLGIEAYAAMYDS